LAAHLDPDSSASDGTNPPSARPGTSLPPSAAPETKQILDAIIKAEHIDPELLRLRLEDIRTRLPLRYGPLLTLLQLSPAQVGTFEALMLRRAEASFGLMVEKFTHDYTDDSSEFLAVKERVHRETIAPINDSLRALLGADGYARFAEYEKLAPARPFVDALAAALYFTNQPLTTAQSVELATALAGSANGAPDWKNLGAPAAISRLQTILSPAQLATFELLCRQSDGQRKMAERRDQLRSRVIDEAVAAGSGK
jgi:hypothetical protein